MTQRALATVSGVHQPTIAAIETGHRQPTGRVRAALDAAVRVRPSEALAAHRQEVREAIARRHGRDPFVFGSTARGEDTVDSDLDLMVTFDPGTTDLIDLMDLVDAVSYTHLRAHETDSYLVCRLLLEKKKNTNKQKK